MKLSKTSKYTLRLLSFMVNSGKQVFSSGLLAKELNMPDKYLRRIMTNMSKKGFVKSIRGKNGGYVFAKNANSITLWDVINAVEGVENYTGCILGFSECSDENPCSLHDLYVPVRNRITSFLNTTTIADLNKESINKF